MGALDLFPKDAAGVPMYESPYHVADYAAGMYAVIGALAALLADSHGPVHLEAPLFAAGLAWAFPMMSRSGFGARSVSAESAASGLFMTKDGRILSLSAIEDSGWLNLCRVMGLEDLAARKDLASLPMRRPHAVEINERLREVFATRPLNDWEVVLSEANISFGPVRTVAEGVVDEAVESLDLLHLDPTPHIGCPIFGLPTVVHVAAPELDSSGAAVRATGWAALGASGHE